MAAEQLTHDTRSGPLWIGLPFFLIGIVVLLLATDIVLVSGTRSLRRKAAMIQIGDTEDHVRSILGNPQESCKTLGGTGGGLMQLLSGAPPEPEWWAYGSLVHRFEWQWPPTSKFPWVAQFKIHLFSPDPNEVAIYFDSTGRVVRVHIPSR